MTPGRPASSQEPAEGESPFRVVVSWSQGSHRYVRLDSPSGTDQLSAWAAWRGACREPRAFTRGARGPVADVVVELLEWVDGRSHVRAKFPGPEPTSAEGGNPPVVSPARIRSTIEALAARQKLAEEGDDRCSAGCGRVVAHYDPDGRPWCDEHRDGPVFEPEQGEML